MATILGPIQEDSERGEVKDTEAIIDEVAEQANREIRLGFTRKVYSLLAVQLLMTLMIGAVFCTVEPVKLFIQQRDWMIGLAMVLCLIIIIPLYILRKENPINLILLAAYTVVQAYSIGVLISYFDVAIVLQTLFITMAVVVGLTLFTFNTKRDFSSLHSVLFTGLCVVVVGGIMQLIIQNTLLELVVSVIGAIIFSLYIVFDTQLLIRTLSPEEYIFATIRLYLDILNLFLCLLRLRRTMDENW